MNFKTAAVSVIALSALALTGCAGASSTPSAAPAAPHSASAAPVAAVTPTAAPKPAGGFVSAPSPLTPEQSAKFDAALAKMGKSCFFISASEGIMLKSQQAPKVTEQGKAVLQAYIDKIQARLAELKCTK